MLVAITGLIPLTALRLARYSPKVRWSIISVLTITISLLYLVYAENRSLGTPTGNSGIAPGVELRLILKEGIFQDTRSSVWAKAYDKFQEAPILGHGWFHLNKKWATVQSAYLQVLVEAGLLGAALFLAFLVKVPQDIFRAWKNENLYDQLCAIFLAALLVHGLTESSLVLGTSPHSFFLAFTVCRLDIRRQDLRGTVPPVHLRHRRRKFRSRKPEE